MGIIGKILGLEKEQEKQDMRAIVVHRPEGTGDAEIRGREVRIWRPPVMLDKNGNTMPGVSKQMIANYLVSTTSALTETDLGAVTVTWKEQQGRFATTDLTIHAWNQTMTILHPIAPVDQDVQDVLGKYQRGIIGKVRELHKGHQSFRRANQEIQTAIGELEKLRDSHRPMFNDVEYMFVRTTLSDALVLSALVPAPVQDNHNVFEPEEEPDVEAYPVLGEF